MKELQGYDWPGNIRELEHVILRAMILSPGSTLVLDEAVLGAPTARDSYSGSLNLEEMERAHILSAMERCGWKLKGNAADRLGLNPSPLHSRMKKLRIERPQRNS